MDDEARSRLALRAVLVGDEVIADDGRVGRVERVVRSERREVRYVVVTSRRGLLRRHPVVPVGLITHVDGRTRRIRVRGSRASVVTLPETVPLVL